MRLIGVLVGVTGIFSISLEAAPIPSPPRHGRYTVQAMFGGRSTIPMCIVPPRTYIDGKPIPPGTQCTIVVYRSMQEGKPGTYTQEVGRGVGPIEREWIDVAANVPCDDPKGGVIYLASSAIINGVESDLNNQYTTIIWSPGEFSVKEYPAAGSKPGSPPRRKNAPTSTSSAGGTESEYPEWMRDLGRAATSVGTKSGYEIVTPPLTEFSPEFGFPDVTLTMRFVVGTNGTITGQTDLDQFVAITRAEQLVSNVEVPRNEITGRLIGESLVARPIFVVAVTAKLGDETKRGVLTVTTELNGTTQAGGEIRGQAHTSYSFALSGEQLEDGTHDWQFVAKSQDVGGTVLLAPDIIEDELGAPGIGFATGGSRFAGGIVGSPWQKNVVGTVELGLGETHLFTLEGRYPTNSLDSVTGIWRPVSNYRRHPGDFGQWYAGPASVLESEPVGNALRVRAVGNGIGEVWARSLWDVTLDNGQTVTGPLISIWIVPVGEEARQKVLESQGRQPSVVTNTSLPGVLSRVAITGRVVMRGTRQPVADAQIQLIYPEGGAVYLPEWKTREDGRFRIVANTQLPGGGLPPNEYEVFVFKGDADATADPATATENDLWPVSRYMVTVTQEAAAAGNIPVGALIQLDYVKNIDFTKRENTIVRGTPKTTQ
ncbi:MAG: hypothetical protein ACUVX8_16650 [Candidatus Zipacnadales bacterium]